jgi:hypothetical protein
MPHFPSRRRLAQVALPTMICAALVAGAARARSARPADDAMPLEVAQADTTQPSSPAPATGPIPGGEAGHGPHMHPGWGMGGMEHRDAWAAGRRLRLADRLATMHVYLDIAPAQEDAWHGFSQALLAMVPDPKDSYPGVSGAFEGIDRMAKMMQRRADAAQALDQAAQKLKAVMTPAQIQKADAAWASMREHWRHVREHGWHHQGHHGHGMDDR